MDTKLIVENRYEEIVRLPVLLAVAAAVVAPWLVVLSAALALICGCSVHLERAARARAYTNTYDRSDDDSWKSL